MEQERLDYADLDHPPNRLLAALRRRWRLWLLLLVAVSLVGAGAWAWRHCQPRFYPVFPPAG
jgi:hypothetical protein